MIQNFHFTLPDDATAVRVDKFLSDALPEFSRTAIARGKIVVNGVVARPSMVVLAGFSVDLEIDVITTTATKIMPEKRDLDIVFEDEDIVVVNKSRGLSMYPGAGHHDGTLVNALLAHTGGKLSALGGEFRPGIVHRLDKDTSGLCVVAKNDFAFAALARAIAAHEVVRKYTALCWGIPKIMSGTITGNIARSSRNRQKMSMVAGGGKEATTLFEVVAAWARADASRIKCTLETGRTHQIRVHLSAHGFPVIGDPLYGKDGHKIHHIRPSELLDFLTEHKSRGQFLHAGEIAFSHPRTGEKLSFRAALPDDMKVAIELLDDYLV